MNQAAFRVVVEVDEQGFVYAHVPDIPEVQAQGRTIAEGHELAEAASADALELRRERGEELPV